MIIVRFKGGCGNQLFQYAAGLALATQHGVPLLFDLRWYDRPEHQRAIGRAFELMHFAVHGRVASPAELKPFFFGGGDLVLIRVIKKIMRSAVGRRIWICDEIAYSPAFEKLGRQVLMEGYFQDIRYFEEVQSQLKEHFSLNNPLPPEIIAYAAWLSDQASVCIQVRRTDFVSNIATSARHGVCDLGYFTRAWAEIRKRIPDANAFVFADDLAWAHEAFRDWKGAVIVGPEWNGPAFMYKFFLMRSCRHFIIANSTWGWWAAWLGHFPEKIVVMPQQWFAGPIANDAASGLYLPGWLRC